MVKKIVTLIYIFSIGTLLYAQNENRQTNNTNEYQRYDIVLEEMELKLESTLRYWFEDIAGKTIYTLNPGLSAELNFKKHHSIKANLAYTFGLLDDYNARNRVYYSPNDIELAYEYIKQINNLNLFFGPNFTIPLGVSNEYSIREGVLSSGLGHYTVGGNIAIAGIRDPVVWNIEFDYRVGLPKEERFAVSWLPGIMQFSFGFTDLLNDRFGFSLGIQQQVTLPEIRNGTTIPDTLEFSTNCKTEIFVLFESNYIRAAFDALVYPRERPFSISLIYGHIFRKK